VRNDPDPLAHVDPALRRALADNWAKGQELAATHGMEYLKAVPRSAEDVPRGKIVVHNRVQPALQLGTRGFRAWLASPSGRYVPCECSWAPQLGAHYKVVK
jgi:hypothetical protein